jgi:hypothetical protein
MLVKRTTLDAIVARDIDLVFRRWKRATVKTGGTLRTSVGMLDIIAVDRITIRQVTPDEAKRAGYATKTELLRSLRGRSGDLYRVTVSVGGEDPLVELRSDTDIDAAQLADVRSRLARMDASSPSGPWTSTYLEILRDNPHVRAEDLATGIGLDKPTFKNNVRKLKKLGLTISHSPGYELSPRGHVLLMRL